MCVYHLPVFAGSNTAFSVAQIEQLEDLLLRDLVICFILMLVLVFSLFLAAFASQLLASVLLENLESTAKTLSLLLHVDSLLIKLLLFESFGLIEVWSVRVVVIVLAVVDWGHRLPCQVQGAEVNYTESNPSKVRLRLGIGKSGWCCLNGRGGGTYHDDCCFVHRK